MDLLDFENYFSMRANMSICSDQFQFLFGVCFVVGAALAVFFANSLAT
jgi:hypothetical protein